MLTELDVVLHHLGQGFVSSGPYILETSDTSDTRADESVASHPSRHVRSKRSYKMKEVRGADQVGRFFVTRAIDADGKLSHFYSRICRRDVLVLKNSPLDVRRHFQGLKRFTLDQRLRLETPGYRVLDFEGNSLSGNELGRQKERILRCSLVTRYREYPSAEDLIVDDSGAPDAILQFLTKVS